MPACPQDREFIVVSSGGGNTAADLPDDLAAQGWRIHRLDRIADVHAFLARQPGVTFAGLLDLRGLHEAADLERIHGAQIATALAVHRVGWVAGIEARQLAIPRVRGLIQAYCHDFVTLPCSGELLGVVLGHAHGMAALADGGEAVIQAAPDGMIGASPAMLRMYAMLGKAALTDAPIFISGETGTGKELAAMAIHRRSSRHEMPFVAINCGAIPSNLIQSELFGYERGAFTGAAQRKLGRIELAHRGTLFLDEIGDLPMDSQAALLRFLQEGKVQRLGGCDEMRVDARIIAATHIDLQAAIADGRFRHDLFHRLHVIELKQPPLRERGDDIVLIANHVLARYAGEGGSRVKGFTLCGLRALHRHTWPGNVRELINRVRQAIIMAEQRYISAADLRLEDADGGGVLTLDAIRGQSEREAIERALRRNAHRLVSTARDLGISRITLYRLMTRHGLRDAEALAATRID